MNNKNKKVFILIPHIFIMKNQHFASRFCITNMESCFHDFHGFHFLIPFFERR